MRTEDKVLVILPSSSLYNAMGQSHREESLRVSNPCNRASCELFSPYLAFAHGSGCSSLSLCRRLPSPEEQPEQVNTVNVSIRKLCPEEKQPFSILLMVVICSPRESTFKILLQFSRMLLSWVDTS